MFEVLSESVKVCLGRHEVNAPHQLTRLGLGFGLGLRLGVLDSFPLATSRRSDASQCHQTGNPTSAEEGDLELVYLSAKQLLNLAPRPSDPNPNRSLGSGLDSGILANPNPNRNRRSRTKTAPNPNPNPNPWSGHTFSKPQTPSTRVRSPDLTLKSIQLFEP